MHSVMLPALNLTLLNNPEKKQSKGFSHISHREVQLQPYSVN